MLINPRYLRGPYEDVTAAQDDAAELQANLAAIALQDSQARIAATKERTDALSAHGIPDIPAPTEIFTGG